MQPADYLTGLTLYLEGVAKSNPAALAKGAAYRGNVLVHEGASIGAGCLIGPDVCIDVGCVIEPGVRIARCTVMRGVRIKAHACVTDSIIGWDSGIGAWGRVENKSVLGKDVQVADEVHLNGAVILPHKEIKVSVQTPQIIL